MAACGLVAALRAKPGANHQLVKPDDDNKGQRRYASPTERRRLVGRLRILGVLAAGFHGFWVSTVFCSRARQVAMVACSAANCGKALWV